MQGGPAQHGGVHRPGCAPAHHQCCLGSGCGTQWPAQWGWGCCRAAQHPPIFPPCSRLFEYRGRVSPVPRVVPVKRPRVTIPLVRRVKATLPVKLFARSAAIANSSAKLKCEYARGLRWDGAETGVHVDLPSPGVHPQGQMLPGKTLKNPKHLEPTHQARAFQKPAGCECSRGRCTYNVSVPKAGVSLHRMPGRQTQRLFWVHTTTHSPPRLFLPVP